MYKKISLVILSFSTLLLSGCANSILDTKDVRCPFEEKGGCQSMDSINKMVSDNRYSADGNYVQQGGDRYIGKGKKLNTGSLESYEPTTTLWVSPWRDKMNALHESSVIKFSAKHHSSNLEGKG